MSSGESSVILKKGLLFGTGFALATSLILSTIIFAQTFVHFQSGDLVSADQINSNFDEIKNRFQTVDIAMERRPPIGSIIAWHKNLTGVPALPAGWVEVSGQTIVDSESPLNGVTLPDLNGQGRFLRGGVTSGTFQADQFQGHWHNFVAYLGTSTGWDNSDSRLVRHQNSYNGSYSDSVQGPVSDGSNGTPRTGTETRPINMSIVWILRVK